LFGVKDAIASKAAIGQRLRVVLESIRRRFRSAIDHGQKLIVFYQHKVDAGAGPLDRTGLHIPSHAQMLGISAVAMPRSSLMVT